MMLVILFCLFTINLHGLFDYDRAILKGNNNDWNSSKELMKKVLVDNPESPTILYDAGVSSFKAGDYEQALSYFTKAEQKSTDRILQEQSLCNAGNSLVKLKKLPEALATYDKVLDLNPNNERALHNKEIVKKMMEQEKQQQQQKNKENNQDKKNQEKDQNQEEDQEKKSSEQQKQQQEQNQQQNSTNTSDQKEQNSSKDSQQQQQQQKDEQAAQQSVQKQAGADQKEGAQKSAAEKKLSASLARILEQHEKKDAALNKKMIQVMVNQGGGAGNDEHAY